MNANISPNYDQNDLKLVSSQMIAQNNDSYNVQNIDRNNKFYSQNVHEDDNEYTQVNYKASSPRKIYQPMINEREVNNEFQSKNFDDLNNNMKNNSVKNINAEENKEEDILIDRKSKDNLNVIGAYSKNKEQSYINDSPIKEFINSNLYESKINRFSSQKKELRYLQGFI